MSKRNSRMRSVGLILIGLMLGAVMIAPAFANHTPKHTKKQIAKVKKSLNKKIKQLPTTSAVAQSIDAALDERINILGDSWVKATATSGADEATARSAAPKVPLFTKAPFTFYGKCFAYPTDLVRAEIFVETTVDGVILNGFDVTDGAPSFVNTTSAEDIRRLESTTASANDASFSEEEVALMAPGGVALNGLVSAAAKKGTLAGGNGIYGDGDVCLFSGFAAGN